MAYPSSYRQPRIMRAESPEPQEPSIVQPSFTPRSVYRGTPNTEPAIPRNNFSEAARNLANAYAEWQNMQKQATEENRKEMESRAEEFYAANAALRLQRREEFNRLVREKMLPQGADPFFQDHLAARVMHEDGIDYLNALAPMAEELGRAVDPKTNQLLPLPDLDQVFAKASAVFEDNPALLNPAGRAEWAKMKVAAQREFLNRLSKVHNAESQKYVEFSSQQEIARALVRFRDQMNADPSASGWVGKLGTLEEAEAELFKSVKAVDDSMAQFAGLDHRTVVVSAIDRFLDSVDPKDALAMLPTIRRMPFGGSTMGADPTIGPALEHQMTLLGKRVRTEELQERADMRQHRMEALDRFEADASRAMLAYRGGDPNKSVQPVVDDFISKIESYGISGDLYKEAVNRLRALRDEFAQASDVADPLAERQRVKLAQDLHEQIRNGLDITENELNALDLRPEDKPKLRAEIDAYRDGSGVLAEAGLARIESSLQDLMNNTDIQSIRKQLKQEKEALHLAARRMAVGSEPPAVRVAKVREYLENRYNAFIRQFEKDEESARTKRDALVAEIDAAHARFLPARSAIMQAIPFISQEAANDYLRADEKYADPFQFSNTNAEELFNRIGSRLRAMNADATADVGEFARHGVETFQSLWTEQLNAARSDTNLAPDQIESRMKGKYPEVFEAALKSAQKLLSETSIAKAAATEDSPQGKQISASAPLIGKSPRDAAAISAQMAKAALQDQVRIHPERFSQFSKDLLNDTAKAFEEFTSQPNAETGRRFASAVDNAIVQISDKIDEHGQTMIQTIRTLTAMRGLDVEEVANGYFDAYPAPGTNLERPTRWYYRDIGRGRVEYVAPAPRPARITRVNLEKIGIDPFITPIYTDDIDKTGPAIAKALGIRDDLVEMFIARQKLLTQSRPSAARVKPAPANVR